jgi:hypothetical protein
MGADSKGLARSPRPEMRARGDGLCDLRCGRVDRPQPCDHQGQTAGDDRLPLATAAVLLELNATDLRIFAERGGLPYRVSDGLMWFAVDDLTGFIRGPQPPTAA